MDNIRHNYEELDNTIHRRVHATRQPLALCQRPPAAAPCAHVRELGALTRGGGGPSYARAPRPAPPLPQPARRRYLHFYAMCESQGRDPHDEDDEDVKRIRTAAMYSP